MKAVLFFVAHAYDIRMNRKDERMYGTVTEYMGTAYTGLGIAHKYEELIASAAETVFLKCPPTNALSDVLNEVGTHYVKRGYHIDKFMNPVQHEITDAVFIKGLDLLFIQASHPIALEPADIGGRHRVVSFYDMYDEEKLREQNEFIVEKLAESETALKKTLKSLAEAVAIHDEWETINIDRMIWELHESLIESLKEELFGHTKLNKTSTVSHRMTASLTSSGSYNFISSITKDMERRLLIKGLRGTGKSTLMRAVGTEAEQRGFDVQYGWCGLDPTGVDIVQIPELSICLIDATEPHEINPEREGDEILDLIHMCKEDEEAEERIDAISAAYKEKILDATGYMQSFSQAEKSVKASMDSAINGEVFEQKAAKLLDLS